eukprot:gene15698-21241_t
MDKSILIQAQIKQNAEEVSSYLSDMKKWEKKIKSKDATIKAKSVLPITKPRMVAENGPSVSANNSIRSGGGTVAINTSNNSNQISKEDIIDDDSAKLTPSIIVNKYNSSLSNTLQVPKARGIALNIDPEEAERERGNQEFKNGNFNAAVKSYTKCLGLKSKNYIAFSNRAMAYLKLKEYHRAVVDCTCALSIEENHIKSLLRRATAYNSIGKHRAALKDLLKAYELDPTNKQVLTDMQSTKEQLRNAVNRAPMITLQIANWDDQELFDGIKPSELVNLQGPEFIPFDNKIE